MSGRGKRFNRGGRGGGQHRAGVKTTNFGNRFNIRRKEQGADDDVSMNTQPASHKILISGYSHGANTEVIRTMLLGKVDGLKFLEFSVQDSKVMASVGTKAEANALQNLSGLLFGNKKLMIKHLERNLPYNNSKSKFTGKNERPTNIRQERAAIEQFVKRHYDADDRILNLSNLANHLPNLNSVDFNNKSFMLQLFDLLGQCCPDILTIVLARNNISKLEAFSSLTKYRVKIMNISLDSNKISDFEQLNALKDLNLRELVLTGNPVGNGLDEVGYQLEVVRRLPDLAYLDTRKIKQGVDTHPVTQLPPIQGNFFDAPNRQALADGFLQKYYEAYDGDRDSLTHAYAEQSCFSISLVGASKPVGRGGSTFRGDKFIPYAPLDRNMTTNKSLDTRTTTLKTGPTHIVGTLLDLPQTKHDYDSFIVDCFVCTMGPFEMLNIFVHGSFTESTKAKRSFSRVFLLAPPPPGSKPDGWPVVIINDQFYIRYFTPKRVKAPQPELPPPATTTTTTTTTGNNNNNNTNNQEEMKTLVLRLSSITRLTPQFAEQCLSQNMWSYEHALANFQDLRAKNVITSEMLMP